MQAQQFDICRDITPYKYGEYFYIGNFNPAKELKLGDTVGLLVENHHGDFVLFVNGKPKKQMRFPIPIGALWKYPVWPVIDLQGATNAVTLKGTSNC